MSSRSYTCRQCNADIEVEVDLGEGDDLPDVCPECGATIPWQAHDELQSDLMADRIDRARDMMKDRLFD